MKPNIEQNEAYLKAFDHFNAALFEGNLSRPMLILSRNQAIIGGYFSPNQWHDGDNKVHEIALNANACATADLLAVMGWLVHEMIHLWQFEQGKPSRAGYHNKEFANKCRALGLEPKDLQTGADVGQKLTTTIISGGLADNAIAALPDEAILPWECNLLHIDQGKNGKKKDKDRDKQKSGSRAKYTCPVCSLNAWAKPGAKIICGDCEALLIEQSGS